LATIPILSGKNFSLHYYKNYKYIDNCRLKEKEVTMGEFKSGIEQLQSMINSLKEITTIIVGLALTNAITQFLVVGGTLREVTEISFESILIFVLLIVNMIRFYHGNFRHLDVTYSLNEYGKSLHGSVKQHPIKEKVVTDFFFILLESLILCVISFYQGRAIYFFDCFISLLIVDVIWFFSTYHFTSSREQFEHQKKWTANNVTAIILLLITCSSLAYVPQAILAYIPSFITYIASVIIIINTVRDYQQNWAFYFPVPSSSKRMKEIK
jgi:hypothetical protein